MKWWWRMKAKIQKHNCDENNQKWISSGKKTSRQMFEHKIKHFNINRPGIVQYNSLFSDPLVI